MDTEPNETQRVLAAMCEEGILQKPRVTDGGNIIRYQLSEKHRQHLAYIAHHPETWEELGIQEYKDLFTKLSRVVKE